MKRETLVSNVTNTTTENDSSNYHNNKMWQQRTTPHLTCLCVCLCVPANNRVEVLVMSRRAEVDADFRAAGPLTEGNQLVL